MQQAPINLAGAIPAGGGEVQIHWQPTGGQVVNNGHTIQVNTEGGSAITLEGRRFSLLQFHFHLPSEHTVGGSSFPMEVHFVHQAEEGDLAVIGVFMDSGEAHAAIQAVWDAIPGVEESPAPLADFDPNALLPEGRGYSWYAGSLTTPPSAEVVSRAVHALQKPERPTIPPAPASMDTGIISALGSINLPTLLLRRFASLDSCCPSSPGDPKGGILRVSFAIGFNSARRRRRRGRPPKPVPRPTQGAFGSGTGSRDRIGGTGRKRGDRFFGNTERREGIGWSAHSHCRDHGLLRATLDLHWR